MSSAHFPTFSSLHLRHISFSNSSVALPTSQLVSNPSLFHLHHSSFSNPSFRFYVTGSSLTSSGEPWRMSRPFRHFTYVITHPPSLPSLNYITENFPTLRCFTYVTAHSPTLLFASPTSQALHLRHLASRPCIALDLGHNCTCGIRL